MGARRRQPTRWHRDGRVYDRRPPARTRAANGQAPGLLAMPSSSSSMHPPAAAQSGPLAINAVAGNAATVSAPAPAPAPAQAPPPPPPPPPPLAPAAVAPGPQAPVVNAPQVGHPGRVVLRQTNYVDTHTNEIFHHRGARNWGEGLPSAGMRASTSNVRIPLNIARQVQQQLGVNFTTTETKYNHAVTTAARLTPEIRRALNRAMQAAAGPAVPVAPAPVLVPAIPAVPVAPPAPVAPAGTAPPAPRSASSTESDE